MKILLALLVGQYAFVAQATSMLPEPPRALPAALTAHALIGKWRTLTESEWGAVVTLAKGGHLRIEFIEYSTDGGAPSRRVETGKWIFERGLVTLEHEGASDRYLFHEKVRSPLLEGPVDTLQALSQKESALESETLYRAPFKIKNRP